MKFKIAEMIFKRKARSMGQCEELAKDILACIAEEKSLRAKEALEAINPPKELFSCQKECGEISYFTIGAIMREEEIPTGEANKIETINTCKVCFKKEEMLNKLDIAYIAKVLK